MPLKTPLYDLHVSGGSKIVEFAGWLLPVQYSGIISEHKAVRTHAGLFDIGHMGQIHAYDQASLQALTVNDLLLLDDRRGQYSFMCSASGGVIDDLIIFRLGSGWLVIANAVNAVKVHALISECDPKAKISYKEMTALALQGPSSLEILQGMTDIDLKEIRHRQLADARISGKECMLSRSGYSGEDGFEIFLRNSDCPSVWSSILKRGAVPCGLGSRDTLRIEAGLPLYGHEIDENTTPLEAGYIKTVKFSKPEFAGRKALICQKETGAPKRLIGFETDGKHIPRQGYKIFCGSEECGYVTSGTLSPSLEKPVGMGYIKNGADPKDLRIEIRGDRYIAKEVPLPFYRRKSL